VLVEPERAGLFFEVTSSFTAVGCPSIIWYDARTSLPGWISFTDPCRPSTVIAVGDGLSLSIVGGA